MERAAVGPLRVCSFRVCLLEDVDSSRSESEGFVGNSSCALVSSRCWAVGTKRLLFIAREEHEDTEAHLTETLSNSVPADVWEPAAASGSRCGFRHSFLGQPVVHLDKIHVLTFVSLRPVTGPVASRPGPTSTRSGDYLIKTN